MRQSNYDYQSSSEYYKYKQDQENQSSKREPLKEKKDLLNTYQMNNINLNNINQKIIDKINLSNQIKLSKLRNTPLNNNISQTNSNRKNIFKQNNSFTQLDDQNIKKNNSLYINTNEKESNKKNNNNIFNTSNNYIDLNNNDEKLDKNIKNYIDEQNEKIKEFVHDEINNLHMDLIKQFEIQNSQNLQLFQKFFSLNAKLQQEIDKLKQENKFLKQQLEQ